MGGGFSEQQAEILADEQVTLLNSNLATKVDIEILKQETKADIARIEAGIEALRQKTKANIETINSRLIKWCLGVNDGSVRADGYDEFHVLMVPSVP